LIVRNVQRLKSLLNWNVLSDKKGNGFSSRCFARIGEILKDRRGQFADLIG